MTVQIAPADLASPTLVAFLQAHLDEMEPTAPPESRHALDLAGLAAPGVRLWVATVDGVLAGTGGLAPVGPGHLEIKSMRTDPAQRGRGVGARLVEHLLAQAEAAGARRVSLETGSMDFFIPARSLYAHCGFVECGPFGSYLPDPNSTFMTVDLTVPRTAVQHQDGTGRRV